MRFLHLLPPALLLLSPACGRVSQQEARTLIQTYNDVVSEAYRQNDIQLIDKVVAPNCIAGKNLTGLIGVRLDMGITLDAHLDDLQIVGVTRDKEELQIRTRERWSYQDLRVGTGERVGEPSVDHYELLYLLKKTGGAWLVTETKFTREPQVGRTVTPWQMDAKDAHAMVPAEPPPGAKP